MAQKDGILASTDDQWCAHDNFTLKFYKKVIIFCVYCLGAAGESPRGHGRETANKGRARGRCVWYWQERWHSHHTEEQGGRHRHADIQTEAVERKLS